MSSSTNLDNPIFKGLTNRERIFVLEYVIDLNAYRAAKEAGYSSAKTYANRIMRRPRVKRAIKKLMKPRMEEANLAGERILKQLENFLFFDLLEWVDEEGGLKCAPSELPEAVRQAITEIDTTEHYDRYGNCIQVRHKIKTVDKMAALEKALKHKGLYAPEKKEVDVDVRFWDDFYKTADKKQIEDTIEGEILSVTVEEDDEE